MPPQADTEKVQQTPNPEAQLPSTVPDLSLHSVELKHVPNMVESDLAVHWSLGNVTIVNSENTPAI